MAQQLQIDETMAATLAPGIQDVDVTDRGTDLTLHVRQTLGNDRELYVLYDVTLAGTVILPRRGRRAGSAPQTVTLQGVEERTAHSGSVQTAFLDKERQTITYLSYFSRGIPWPAGDLRLSVGDFVSDATSLTQEVAEATWTPTNQGDHPGRRDPNPGRGETVGSVTLTPFSLSYTFTQGAQPKMEEIGGTALPSGYLLDSQGMARQGRQRLRRRRELGHHLPHAPGPDHRLGGGGGGVCGPPGPGDGGAGKLGCPGHGTGGLGPGVLLLRL